MIRWIETLAERVPEHTPAASSAQGSDRGGETAVGAAAAPIPSLPPVAVDMAEFRPRRRSAPKHRGPELPPRHYAALLLATAEGQELIAARRAVRGCPMVERQVGVSAEGASYSRHLADVPGEHPALRYRAAQLAAERKAIELGMPPEQWLSVSIALDTDDAAMVKRETIRIELPKPVFMAPPLPPRRAARTGAR